MTLQAHLDFINNHILSEHTSGELADAVLRLQRGLTGDRRLIQTTYMQEKLHLSAYLSYYWPISYLQMEYCLQEILAVSNGSSSGEMDKGRQVSILDVGSGPGPMSAALLDFLASQPRPPVSVNCYLADTSAEALEKAEAIIKAGKYLFDIEIRKVRERSISSLALPGTCFDYIIFGHSLNEISAQSAAATQQVFDMLEMALAETGLALFIEPSLLKTSRNLITLRNYLVKTKKFFCIAPCPNSETCTVLEAGDSHTCHDSFEGTIPELTAKIAKMLGLNRETIKMTWFAFSRQPALNAVGVFRIVSDPMLNKAGRVRFIVCGASGRTSLSAHKDDAHAKSIGFFSLARGDTIILENAEPRTNGMGIGKATAISLHATK